MCEHVVEEFVWAVIFEICHVPYRGSDTRWQCTISVDVTRTNWQSVGSKCSGGVYCPKCINMGGDIYSARKKPKICIYNVFLTRFVLLLPL